MESTKPPAKRIAHIGTYECRGYGCDFTDAELSNAGYRERRCAREHDCLRMAGPPRMSDPAMFTQVTVRRGPTGDSIVHEDVWWIRTQYAIAGRRVRDEDGRVWLVAEVHGERHRAFLDAQTSARAQLAYVLGESDENPRPMDRWCEIFYD